MQLMAFIAILIILGLLLGRRTRSDKRHWYELGAMVAVMIVLAVIVTYIYAPLHLNFPYYESDFVDYCINLKSFSQLDAPASPKRTRFAGLMAWFFSRYLGVVNGIAFASIVCTAALFVGIYWWARLLAGRIAGWGALSLALCMTPLIGLSRIVNFYPMIILTLVVGALTCCWAIVRTKPSTMFMAGLGIGALLLVDVRGLIWAAPYCCFLVVTCFVSKLPLSQKLACLGALIVPIYVSWFCGWWSYPPSAKSLEAQLDVRPLFWSFDRQFPGPPWEYPSHFVWGRRTITGLPNTFYFLWQQHQIEPPAGYLAVHGMQAVRDAYHTFWNGCGAIFAGCSLLLLSKNRRFFALWISIIPFVIAYIGAQSMVEFQLRFYAHGLPAMAVLGGAALARVLALIRPWSSGFPDPYRLICLLLLLAAVTLGWLPSVFSPSAPWRPDWKANAKSLTEVQLLIERKSYVAGKNWQSDCAIWIEGEQRLWIYESGERALRDGR